MENLLTPVWEWLQRIYEYLFHCALYTRTKIQDDIRGLSDKNWNCGIMEKIRQGSSECKK